jgi:hypothetical protein
VCLRVGVLDVREIRRLDHVLDRPRRADRHLQQAGAVTVDEVAELAVHPQHDRRDHTVTVPGPIKSG